MQQRIPHFTYDPPKSFNGYTACIGMDGEIIHQIKDLNAFYKELGYTEETRKAGVLPDEFIWEEYTKSNRFTCASCLQLHLIEYLVKNSIAFVGKYGHQYQNWFDDHIKAATEGNISLAPCMKKAFCLIGTSILKSQPT